MSVSLHHQLVLFTQLESLLGKGFNLEQSILIIEDQQLPRALTQFLDQIAFCIKQGSCVFDMSASKSVHPLYKKLIAFGIQSGCLAKSLGIANGYISRLHTFRKRLSHILFYPIVLLCATLAVTGIMILFVVPRLASFFKDNGYACSFGMYAAGLKPLVALLCGVGIMCILIYYKAPALFAHCWKHSRTRLPFYTLLTDYYLISFLRYVGIFLDMGLSEAQALKETSILTLTPCVAQLRDHLVFCLHQGQTLACACTNTRMPLCLTMQCTYLAHKQELACAFHDAANFIEDRWQTRLQTALSYLEPALIVLCGLLVGTAAMIMFAPFMQMISIVGT